MKLIKLARVALPREAGYTELYERWLRLRAPMLTLVLMLGGQHLHLHVHVTGCWTVHMR